MCDVPALCECPTLPTKGLSPYAPEHVTPLTISVQLSGASEQWVPTASFCGGHVLLEPLGISALTSTGLDEAMAWGLPSQSQAELCSLALGMQGLAFCKMGRRPSLVFTLFFLVK